jgi:exodeoxyribonuclease VII large subunit
MLKSINHNKANYFKVSEISEMLKQLLEENFNNISIKGEVSGLKNSAAGHIYFNLKDENAVLNTVCWKNVVESINVKLEDGMEIICSGKISSYPSRSNYQFIANKIEIEGIRSLLAAFEKKKNVLAAEGLFDSRNKKSLPRFPKHIAIITSVNGAVIHDMLHRISNRFPINILVYNTAVQGLEAPGQIIEAISQLNIMTNPPEVIVIARGGGAIEDLWCFNDEELVRAIAASQIPIISAIGHEVDFTLSDFAADLRAPTPSAAAEMVVPVLKDVRHNLQLIFNKICSSFDHAIEIKKRDVQKHLYTFSEIHYLLNDKIQATINIEKHITYHTVQHLANQMHTLSLLEQTIEKYNQDNILKRGFAIIKDTTGGEIISSTNKLIKSDKALIEMYDGVTEVIIKQ